MHTHFGSRKPHRHSCMRCSPLVLTIILSLLCFAVLRILCSLDLLIREHMPKVFPSVFMSLWFLWLVLVLHATPDVARHSGRSLPITPLRTDGSLRGHTKTLLRLLEQGLLLTYLLVLFCSHGGICGLKGAARAFKRTDQRGY